jgi:two-component system chemotaxis response regulator CheY
MVALVVDDSQTVRLMLRNALLALGVKDVVLAESAEKATVMLKITPQIDLILTDWHMPGMNGLELLQKLRSMPRFKRTPIIMSTSESAGENVVAALRAGATNYIIKPFDKDQLVEKIGPHIKASLAAAGSSSGLPSVTQNGTLADGELGSILQFLMQSRKTGRCELDAPNCTATIYFVQGRITGAAYQLQRGEAAFFTCFNVPIRRYRFREGEVLVAEDATIIMNSTALLIEALARCDQSKTCK